MSKNLISMWSRCCERMLQCSSESRPNRHRPNRTPPNEGISSVDIEVYTSPHEKTVQIEMNNGFRNIQNCQKFMRTEGWARSFICQGDADNHDKPLHMQSLLVTLPIRWLFRLDSCIFFPLIALQPTQFSEF